MNKVSKLVGLAQAEIGSLTNEEKILLEKSEQGERVDYSGQNKQSIRAELIEWLCRDSQAMSLVSHHGIKIKGVRINKVLDLRLAEITVPLIFEESSLPKGINLENSKICLLDLSGSQTGSINLANSEVKNGVFMRGGLQAKGLICLDGAKIGRVLDCTGSKFINPGKCCLEANGVKVTGSVLLHNGFKAEGMVGLVGTTIEGNLECNQGVFLNKGKVAINGNGLKVHGDVFLCDGFWGEGEVKLVRVEIDGSLECDGPSRHYNRRPGQPARQLSIRNPLHARHHRHPWLGGQRRRFRPRCRHLLRPSPLCSSRKPFHRHRPRRRLAHVSIRGRRSTRSPLSRLGNVLVHSRPARPEMARRMGAGYDESRCRPARTRVRHRCRRTVV